MICVSILSHFNSWRNKNILHSTVSMRNFVCNSCFCDWKLDLYWRITILSPKIVEKKVDYPTFALPYLSNIDCAKEIVCALSSTYWTSSTTHQEDSLADWFACCAHSKYRGLIVDNRNKRKHTVLVCVCLFFILFKTNWNNVVIIVFG